MNESNFNKSQLDADVSRQMAAIKERCKTLFDRLNAKYHDEAAICDLVKRECEVEPRLFASWLNSPPAQPLPNGTVKRIYGLLKGAWENPQPTDFPKGPQEPQALKAKVPDPAGAPDSNATAKENGKKHVPKGRRLTHADRIQAFDTKYRNLPPISAAKAQEALRRLQQPGGSILPDYKPDS
jgi:hypothetical protein